MNNRLNSMLNKVDIFLIFVLVISALVGTVSCSQSKLKAAKIISDTDDTNGKDSSGKNGDGDKVGVDDTVGDDDTDLGVSKKGCSLGDRAIDHGGQLEVFNYRTVPPGAACNSVLRYCSEGKLSSSSASEPACLATPKITCTTSSTDSNTSVTCQSQYSIASDTVIDWKLSKNGAAATPVNECNDALSCNILVTSAGNYAVHIQVTSMSNIQVRSASVALSVASEDRPKDTGGNQTEPPPADTTPMALDLNCEFDSIVEGSQQTCTVDVTGSVNFPAWWRLISHGRDLIESKECHLSEDASQRKATISCNNVGSNFLGQMKFFVTAGTGSKNGNFTRSNDDYFIVIDDPGDPPPVLTDFEVVINCEKDYTPSERITCEAKIKEGVATVFQSGGWRFSPVTQGRVDKDYDCENEFDCSWELNDANRNKGFVIYVEGITTAAYGSREVRSNEVRIIMNF